MAGSLSWWLNGSIAKSPGCIKLTSKNLCWWKTTVVASCQVHLVLSGPKSCVWTYQQTYSQTNKRMATVKMYWNINICFAPGWEDVPLHTCRGQYSALSFHKGKLESLLHTYNAAFMYLFTVLVHHRRILMQICLLVCFLFTLFHHFGFCSPALIYRWTANQCSLLHWLPTLIRHAESGKLTMTWAWQKKCVKCYKQTSLTDAHWRPNGWPAAYCVPALILSSSKLVCLYSTCNLHWTNICEWKQQTTQQRRRWQSFSEQKVSEGLGLEGGGLTYPGISPSELFNNIESAVVTSSL